jgi:predicted flap endonuclease-1-like 5' DNA nuclease
MIYPSRLSALVATRARRAALAVLVALPLVAAGRTARASHYAIQDVPHLITAGEVEKLHKAGVDTTEQLLDRAAKPKDRKALSKSSGLGLPALLELARRCDLLRIKGVGSEMVLLLQAAGVQSTADLAKRDPASLIAAVSSANQAKKISEKPPTEPQLQHWIEEAKKLPIVLEPK